MISAARLIGASAHIAFELSKTPSTTLHTVFSIMEGAGASPLLLAALGFVGTVSVSTDFFVFCARTDETTVSNMDLKIYPVCDSY